MKRRPNMAAGPSSQPVLLALDEPTWGAWTSLLSRGGTILSIVPQLAVLGAFAALFPVSATVRLRRVVA